MASAVAASTAMRFLPRLPDPWRPRRARALPPLTWRPPAVTVVASSSGPGEAEGERRGRTRRRRARGAEQEDGISLSSEKETVNSTPRAQTNKDVEPVPVSSTNRKGAIRKVTLVVLAAVVFGVSIVWLLLLRSPTSQKKISYAVPLDICQ